MSSQPAGNIDVGAVFGRVLSTYRKAWRVLLLGALIVFAPIALLVGLIVASGSGAALFLVFAATIVGTFWYQGMVVETVRDVQDGAVDNSVGQLFGSVTPVLGTLIGVGFLAALGIVGGLILLIIPGLILLTIWAVVAPVVVIERKGAFESFGRSRELVRGNGWQVFGVLVALFALNIVLSIVAGIIGAAGDGAAVIAQLAQYMAFAPVSALAAAIIYFALREAHGDAVLAQPTGVLSGGFVPPVPPVPETPEAPAAAATRETPETTAPAAAPETPAPAPPPAEGSPVADAPDPAAVAPADSHIAVEPAPAGSHIPVDAEPARQPDPPLVQPVPGAPNENAPAEGAFGAPEPSGDPFGMPQTGEDPPAPPSAPRDPGQSVAPPGWNPPAGS